MKEYFERLRAFMKEFEDGNHPLNSYFENALFPPPPWEKFEQNKEDISSLVAGNSNEKVKTFESLNAFVQKKTEHIKEEDKKKVYFSGGEISIKKSSCDVIHECDCDAPIIENKNLLAIFVGDLLETSGDADKINDINTTLTKMIGAMNLSEGEFERKPSLRYYLKEDDSIEDKKILDRFYSYIYRNQIKVVLTFGAMDSRSIIGVRDRLARIHGKFIEKEIKFLNGVSYRFQIVPIFHPEYLKVNPSMRKTTWEDLQGVMRFLGKV